MRDLRAPDGCPWDAQQTPESLAPYILEEACELIDAIESGRVEQIQDELGDLLLQVIFQAQIFQERGHFDFYDVATGIAQKLIRRHPHVFPGEGAKINHQDLDQQWEMIKQSERTHQKSCLADHLPSNLPALQRAQKLVKRMSKTDCCLDLPDFRNLLVHLIESTEANESHPSLDEQAYGQCLLQLVKMAESAGIDAEAALRKTIRTTLREFDTA